MDLSDITPHDGDVFALSDGDNYLRAEFVETLGVDGVDHKIAWRLYDRLGRGVLVTEGEIALLAVLTSNYRAPQ